MRQTVFLIITILFFMSGLSECPAQETPEEAYTRIRSIRRETRDPAQAAQEALEFLNNYPEKDIHRQKIHYEYAAALFQQEKFSDAKTAFLNLVMDYKDTTLDKNSTEFMVDDAQYFAAMIEQTQGDKDIDKAIAGYKAVVENFPGSNWRPNALFTLGDLSREKENWSDSLDYYYRVVREYPENQNLAPTALFWANRVLGDKVDDGQKKFLNPLLDDIERTDRQGEIKGNIEIVLRHYPESKVAPEMLLDYVNYLAWRITPENKKEFISTCEKLIEEYPDSTEAYYARRELVDAKILWRESKTDLDDAKEMIEEDIEKAVTAQDFQKVADRLYARARVEMLKGEYDEVRKTLGEALAAAPNWEITYEIEFLIGYTYFREEDYAKAEQFFEKVYTDMEDTDRKDVHSICKFYIALCREKQGLTQESLDILSTISEDYPEFRVSQAASKFAGEILDSIFKAGKVDK